MKLIMNLILEIALFLFWALVVLVVGCCLALSSRADELLEGEEPVAPPVGNATNGERHP